MWIYISAFLDIVIVAAIIYRLLALLVGTRGIQLVKGFLILGTLALFASAVNLRLLSWFLNRIFLLLGIGLPIVFQPELRKILEELGRGNFWHRRMGQEQAEILSQEIVSALGYMKANRIGALIVLQQETGLKEYWRTAVSLNAEISQELIISIFWKDNPLHDGAVIMDQKGIIAAGCYLPLTENSDISRWYGTRHRAALGITDVSDAMSLIVSEERGEVALAYRGHLSKNLKDAQLQKLLLFYFSGTRETPNKGLTSKVSKFFRSFWSA